MRPAPERPGPGAAGTAVTARGVNKWFGDFHALRDVDLTVEAGSKTVVCGPSGSGKSTLIRCLNGLEPFQEGRLEVLGRDLAALSPAGLRTLRREVGMIFQAFNLFPHLTVEQNLTFAPRRVLKLSADEARRRAEAELERVRMSSFAGRYPENLSGGQKQRVAIARALCMFPRLLLLDEPTSALDPEMVGEVLDVLAELAADGGATIVCVTHEMGFARKAADTVVFMDEGSVVEVAPVAAFFDRPRTDRAKRFVERLARS